MNPINTNQDFESYMLAYFKNKQNQLNFGVRNMPSRVMRRQFGLHIAPLQPIKLDSPFSGVHVEKIYQVNPDGSFSSFPGKVKLIFDQNGSDRSINYMTLQANDSFTVGEMVAQAYLTWDAADSDGLIVIAEIVFFNDIDYRSGTLLSETTGGLEVTNAPSTELNVVEVGALTQAAAFTISGSGTLNNNSFDRSGSVGTTISSTNPAIPAGYTRKILGMRIIGSSSQSGGADATAGQVSSLSYSLYLKSSGGLSVNLFDGYTQVVSAGGTWPPVNQSINQTLWDGFPIIMPHFDSGLVWDLGIDVHGTCGNVTSGTRSWSASMSLDYFYQDYPYIITP